MNDASLALAEAGLIRHLFKRMGTFFKHHARDFSRRASTALAGDWPVSCRNACELTHAEMRRCGEFFHGELNEDSAVRKSAVCIRSDFAAIVSSADSCPCAPPRR
jgi:hypothetical protein